MRHSYEAMNLALASGGDLLPFLKDVDPEIVVEMGVSNGYLDRPLLPSERARLVEEATRSCWG